MEDRFATFSVEGSNVYVHGYPELEGRKGILVGEGMAFFFGQGYGNHELFVANTYTGTLRQLSTASGCMLVDDSEIDYEAIVHHCKHGFRNAKEKTISYAGVNRWGGFKDGVCAISWMLYPEGRYFADSDGFGADDNDEEMVYAIIDSHLVIVEPFRPVKDVDRYLEQYRCLCL